MSSSNQSSGTWYRFLIELRLVSPELTHGFSKRFGRSLCRDHAQLERTARWFLHACRELFAFWLHGNVGTETLGRADHLVGCCLELDAAVGIVCLADTNVIDCDFDYWTFHDD